MKNINVLELVQNIFTIFNNCVHCSRATKVIKGSLEINLIQFYDNETFK